MKHTRSSAYVGEDASRRQLSVAVFLFLMVCILGTLGFMWIEDWPMQKALFFTLISITTVGYGDEGVSEAGKLYALVVVLGGFGLTAFTLSLLMQRAVDTRFSGRGWMQSKIDRLKGHTIVCGYGRMGQTICEQLTKDHASFVVIEGDQERFEMAVRNGYLALRGQAADDELLLTAGIERASHIVSAVNSELENLAVTLSASELNPTIEVIARAERDADVRKLRRAGAARTVSPFRAGGLDAVAAILRPAVADSLANSGAGECPLRLAQIVVHPGSPLDTDNLIRFGQNEAEGIAFVALARMGEETMTISPAGSTELKAGDVLIVAGHPEQIRKATRLGANTSLDS